MSTNHFSLESQLFVYYPKYLTNMEPHHQSEYFSRLRAMKTLLVAGTVNCTSSDHSPE